MNIFEWLCRKRISGLITLNKQLNYDIGDLSERLNLNASINSDLLLQLHDERELTKKLKLDLHNAVGGWSLDRTAIPFYEKRIAELKDELGKLRADLAVAHEAHAKATIHVFDSLTNKD